MPSNSASNKSRISLLQPRWFRIIQVKFLLPSSSIRTHTFKEYCAEGHHCAAKVASVFEIWFRALVIKNRFVTISRSEVLLCRTSIKTVASITSWSAASDVGSKPQWHPRFNRHARCLPWTDIISEEEHCYLTLWSSAFMISKPFQCLICGQSVGGSMETYWIRHGHMFCSSCWSGVPPLNETLPEQRLATKRRLLMQIKHKRCFYWLRNKPNKGLGSKKPWLIVIWWTN